MRKIKLSQQERISWLRLARSENVGPATFENLMRFYEKPSEALADLPNWALRGGSKRTIKVASLQQAENEINALETLGARLMFSCDEDYPQLLSSIRNAPPVFSYLGRKDLLSTPSVAFVGARNASLNGKNLTRSMAFDCVESGISVVSGMALGIDGAAHEGALSAQNQNAGTLAVLGCGIDIIYPIENKEIYEQIKENGTLISDFPLGMRPTAVNFPRRNRLISGLSLGTLVVEAKDNSGSLITAEFAKEQGRVIMAVPGSPADDRSFVPNTLIKAGAVLVQNSKDILEAIRQAQTKQKDFYLSETSDKQIDVFRLPDYDDVSLARPAILSALSTTPVSEDELCQHLDIPSSIVSVVLLELELAGRIERHALGRVSMIYGDSDFVQSMY